VASRYSFDGRLSGLWGASAGGRLAALAATSGPGVFESAASGHGKSSDVQAVRTATARRISCKWMLTGSIRSSSDDPGRSLPAGMRTIHANSFESLLVGGPSGSIKIECFADPIAYSRSNVRRS
jgi:hypothetical protein